jgi:hypothetical protein
MAGPLENSNIKKFYQQSAKPFNYVPNDLVDGAPVLPPVMSGLMRIDPNTGNIWISAGNTLVSDWRLITGGGGGGGVTSIIAGTNISITSTGPGGTGAVTINSSGGGATYNGNQGVYKNTTLSPETFQLGGPIGQGSLVKFLEDREIYTDAYTLNFIGTPNSKNIIDITGTVGTSSASGVYVDFSSSNKSNAFYGSVGTGGIGLLIDGIGQGLDIKQLKGSIIDTQSNLPGIVDILTLNNSTNILNGDGARIKLNSAYIESYYTDNSTQTNLVFSVKPTGNTTPAAALELNGSNGQVTLNNYGIGSFVSTPVYNLGVDVGGNIIETTTSSGPTALFLTGDQVINIGSGYNPITDFKLPLVAGKNYSFKATILYLPDSASDETSWSYIVGTSSPTYDSATVIWEGDIKIINSSTSTIYKTTLTYPAASVAIIEGVIYNVQSNDDFYIRVSAQDPGPSGFSITILLGSTLVYYEY